MRKIIFLSLVSLVAITTLGAGCSLSGSSKSADNSKDGGVYKSTDSGTTWSQAVAYPTARSIGSIGTAEILALATDPQDHKVLYAGTSENGLLYSYDSAASWFTVQDANMQTNAISAVAVDPKNICTLFAASGARLYRSTTCGRTFESVYDESREKISVQEIAMDWYNDGQLYIGLSNGDVLKSFNRGETWVKVLAAKDEVSSILVSYQDSRIVLVGADGSFWKSTDGGVSWTEKTDALDSFKSSNKIVALTQDAAGSVVYAASKYGLLKSTDVGETWGSVKLLTAPGEVAIKALAVNPKNANNIYYVTDSTFYVTTDNGADWDTQKLTGGWGASVLLNDPVETSTIYLGREKVED